MSFEIALYESTGPHATTQGGILIEMTRQGGCPFAFSELQKELSIGLCSETGSSGRVGGLRKPPPLPSLDNLEDQSLNTEEENTKFEHGYFESLLNLAQTEYLESRRDGISGLASLSQQESCRAYLTSADNLERVITIIADLLQSYDDRIQRSAAVLLDHLCHNESVRAKVCQGLETQIREWLQCKPENQNTFSELIRRQSEQRLRSALNLSEQQESSFIQFTNGVTV